MGNMCNFTSDNHLLLVKYFRINMRLRAIPFFALLCIFTFNSGIAQTVTEGNTYTLGALSSEKPTITATLMPSNSKISGDTLFTIYEDGVTDFKMYFVEGEEYDNIFNPNPTGMYLNGQEFFFYCNLEKSIRQNFNNILEIYEFTMRGKAYLMLVNFREDCLGDGCAYRCYNLFDITNANRIRQISFSSVFQGMDTFGDFDGNADTPLDFVRVAPKPHEGYQKGDIIEQFLVTAYTVRGSTARQLKNAKKQPYYLYIDSDEFVTDFRVIQADWFFALKDTTGAAAESAAYFAEYISFDPLYQHLYNPDGVRIEKNRWSVFVTDLGDLEAAQEYCRRIQQSFEDVYIMIDQYSGDISFQVFVGNFMSKDLARNYQEQLKDMGIQGAVRDLREAY